MNKSRFTQAVANAVHIDDGSFAQAIGDADLGESYEEEGQIHENMGAEIEDAVREVARDVYRRNQEEQ